MLARELSEPYVTCCMPDTPLKLVAQMMIDRDCGAIPVVLNTTSMRLLGIVTDRDIVCRAVASGRTPLQATAADVMTGSVVTVSPEATVEDCCALMQQQQIRRLPIVDPSGACCGLVALADIARHVDEALAGRLLRQISQPVHASQAVGEAT